MEPAAVERGGLSRDAAEEAVGHGRREGEQEEKLRRARAVARALHDKVSSPGRRLLTSREDPDFLPNYLSNSRLHWIGVWRERFEELFADRPDPPPLLPAAERVVVHVDMDCFFAAVAAAGRPELADVPLAVAWQWGRGEHGGGEVSSANYLARSCGVEKGMWMAEARQRCPDLVVVPYEFERYENVAKKVYETLFNLSPHVVPVSCDEAFVDVTDLVAEGDEEGPVRLAEGLRMAICSTTACTASVGIGPNRLVARVATARAKPDGVHRIRRADARAVFEAMAVRSLPGIGYRMAEKLKGLGITMCTDVHQDRYGSIARALGEKTAKLLVEMAAGEDSRPWPEPGAHRKSFGAQASWGVRFGDVPEVERFVAELSATVWTKASAKGKTGRHVTVKIWEANEVERFRPKSVVGHGDCTVRTKALTLRNAVASGSALACQAIGLVRALRVPPTAVRGIGVQLGSLEARHGAAAADALSDAPGGAGGFRSVGEYHRDKMRRLLTTRPPVAPAVGDDGLRIFAGIRVWVDGGLTDGPSEDELRSLVEAHGGGMAPSGAFGLRAARALHESPTHVITNVVRTGMVDVRRRRHGPGGKGPKLVTPAWVVESVRLARRQPEANFVPTGLPAPGQPKISFPQRKRSQAAPSKDPAEDTTVAKLVEMGYSRHASEAACASAGRDMNAALDVLSRMGPKVEVAGEAADAPSQTPAAVPEALPPAPLPAPPKATLAPRELPPARGERGVRALRERLYAWAQEPDPEPAVREACWAALGEEASALAASRELDTLEMLVRIVCRILGPLPGWGPMVRDWLAVLDVETDEHIGGRLAYTRIARQDLASVESP